MAEPAARPLSAPVLLTEAMAAKLLLHVPPASAEARVSAAPAHTALPPVMAAGAGSIVTTVVIYAPVVAVNVMIAVPADTGVTRPDVAPMAATAVLLLVNEPMAADMVSTLLPPIHSLPVPDMGDNVVFTVINFVL